MTAGEVFQLESLREQSDRHKELIQGQNIYNEKQLQSSHNLVKVTWVIAGATVFAAAVAAGLGFWQNSINERLLGLEKASNDPILSIRIDQPEYPLDETKLIADIHIKNVGPVPVHDLKYGFQPIIQNPVDIGEHLINREIQEKVLSVGEEITTPIYLEGLENAKSVHEIWVGLVFSRFPDGESRCLDLIYVTLPGYENDNPSDCGKWWTTF